MGQKVLVHFDTRKIVAYSLISGVLTSILEYSADFSVTEVGESMFDVIDRFMYCLGQSIDNWSWRRCYRGSS